MVGGRLRVGCVGMSWLVVSVFLVGAVPQENGEARLPVPANGRPIVIEKVLVADCRAVRGFIVAPVDGKLNSPPLGWGRVGIQHARRGCRGGLRLPQ